VVVLDGGEAVVVVDCGAVVVVTDDAPPLPVPPPEPAPPVPPGFPVPALPLVAVVVVVVAGAPPPPPPSLAVDVVVAGGVVGKIEETVDQLFTSPESWRLLDSSVETTSERANFEALLPNPDADASRLTIATRRQDETASVMTLGRRCVVFARKKFLNVPLYMWYKFAVSNHTTPYDVSTVSQFSLMLPG
jgi:hypothetical protein